MKSVHTSKRLNSIHQIGLISLVLFVMTALLLTGCETMETVTQIGTAVGVATGTIDQSQAESIQKSAKA